MPKIKDLGIKVIPETMQPPEMGGGAGCYGLSVICECTNPQTLQACPLHTINCPLHSLQPCPLLSCHYCTHPYTGCLFGSCGALSPCGGTIIQCGAVSPVGCGVSPVCGGSIDPTIYQQPSLTHEQIATLKDQLQKQIAALDEYAKTVGPRTAEEIAVREKQLNDELAVLASRKKNLKT